jgi:hypothetical protein
MLFLIQEGIFDKRYAFIKYPVLQFGSYLRFDRMQLIGLQLVSVNFLKPKSDFFYPQDISAKVQYKGHTSKLRNLLQTYGNDSTMLPAKVTQLSHFPPSDC